MATKEWVEIAISEDIPEGEAKTFLHGDERIAVCRAAGQLYAIQDLCSHDDGPLGEGHLDGFAIQCPRHGAQFDVRTGAVLSMPAIAPILTYPLMEKDGKVSVELSPTDQQGSNDDSTDW